MEFTEFNLSPELQRGIAEAGYVSCMPVQEQVLTHAFGGQDLYVQSQTGTGKTAAFLIVIFQRLLAEPLLNGKKAIIMVPTRELAVQVEEEAKVLGRYLPFNIGSFYGGVGYGQQEQLLRNNVQILVGTPGRVLDLNSSGKMNLMDIAFLVLDEADRMFDMGFYPDLRKLIKVVPPADRRQTMLFSATLNAWVKNLAWEYTKSPFEIEIAPETVTVDEVEQALYHVTTKDKMKMLLGILEREKPESAIIFCNTKRYTEIVARRLKINGYNCEFIIGDLPQVKRQRIIDDVKAGKVKFLVATDVAARGLDIEGLALVVNYDLPVEAENYVHRIGRTARAGKTGRAITLASEQDVYELPDIEKYIGKKLPAEIAASDLYGQDKSEGMRIQTDFYDGRGGSRHDGGGDRRDDRRDGRYRGERPRSEGPRDNNRRPGFGRSDSRQPDSRRPGGRAPDNRAPGGGAVRGQRPAIPPSSRGPRPGPSSNPSPGPGASRDLSHLSFDERMHYYKEKYEGNAPAQAPGRAPGNTPNNKPGEVSRNKQRRGRGEAPNPNAASNSRQAPVTGVQKGPGPTPAPQTQSAQQTQSPPAPGAKKGILGRIMGIFRKK